MGYTKNAISGLSWQTVLKIGTSVLTLAKISILARLLSPTDFGLFSLTAVALGITESLTQTGINLTIIQAKQSVRYFLDTAWVIAIARGFAIGLIMVAVGWGISQWYNEPALFALIAATALVPIIKGFINPAIVSMHKEMKFFQDSAYRFSLSLVETIIALVCGFALHSVWALVVALIGTALFEVLISFVFFADRPVFHYYKSRAEVIINNGKWLGIATLLNYLNENADNVVLGKIVGTHSLGLYQNSYALAHKTNYEMAKSIHHGVIPIFSKLSDQPDRLVAAFKKSLASTIVLSILGSIPLIFFPDLAVRIVLGSKWLEAVPLLPILAAAGAVQSVSVASYTLFLAKKHYHVLNTHLWITLLTMVGLLLWLAQKYGVQGAVWGVLLSRIISLPILVYGVRWSLMHPTNSIHENK